MENNKDFEFTNLPIEAQDAEISASDFKLVDNSNRVHEQKFLTKPTTFFKDSLKRFYKNKSSVVAAGILGTLLLLSFAVPIFDRNDIEKEHPEMIYLEPKLFNAGTGFWDGTKNWTGIAVDVGGHPDATTEEEKQEFWWPSPDDFKKEAVTNKVFTDITYTSDKNELAHGGYVQFGIGGDGDAESVEMSSFVIDSLDIETGDIYLKNFITYDLEKLLSVEGEKAFFPDNYIQGKASFAFNYYVDVDGKDVRRSITLLEENSVFEVSSLNLTDIIKADPYVVSNNITEFKDANFSLVMKKSDGKKNECVLIKALEFETTNSAKDKILPASFIEGNEFMLRSVDDKENIEAYWNCTGYKKLHMAQVIYCDFIYDSYGAVFGIMPMDHYKLSLSDIFKYESKNWCDFDYVPETGPDGKYYITYSFTVLSDKCPLREITNVSIEPLYGEEIYVDGIVDYAKYYGYDSAPRFLLGTDKNGRDMFKYVFEGLRTSLLLGLASFIVCFLFGLIYGSVSGYFGGNVDLVMERITDILSGLPWIVVMTLTILHLGQNFFTFGLAICLTGWIGTASLTRTQFYRFRGREYVLASRSLGASDARLIAKHILPNAMGTIITSAVLMIPSVIFSEATISYLGLGLKGMSSLGVILSDNQTQLTVHPYLLIFPAIVIALLMISFNLFGNGLRDAVNPSLKGEEQ
ncbi:MAG: ABC transporter permease [Bacilli bacterium]|nr:ABC transporter permease [Bacilli bacterium]